MKPHFIPKVVLKQFSSANDDSVVVLNKSEMTYRRRGIGHSTFTLSSNYYGNGKAGTLENELASNDESSITTIINLIRSGQDIDPFKFELKFFLWNNSARNPAFRDHPKVGKLPQLSSENFHRSAMDSIKDEYLLDGIVVAHLRNNLNKLLLPDFSLQYAVLAPDVAIIRVPSGETEKVKSFIFEDEIDLFKA